MDFKLIQGLGISVVVLGVLLVIGSQLTENSRDQVCGEFNADNGICSNMIPYCTDYNATFGCQDAYPSRALNATYVVGSETLDAETDLAGYQGFIVLIGVMTVIILALVSVTGYFKQ